MLTVVMLTVVMLTAVMLTVVMLTVVGPLKCPQFSKQHFDPNFSLSFQAVQALSRGAIVPTKRGEKRNAATTTTTAAAATTATASKARHAVRTTASASKTMMMNLKNFFRTLKKNHSVEVF